MFGRKIDEVQVQNHTRDTRDCGFEHDFELDHPLLDAYFMDKTVTDTDVEKMISRFCAETRELLGEHRELLRHLGIELSLKGSLEAPEIAAIGAKFKLPVLVKEEGLLHIFGYEEVLKKG